jgi:hypothetical protein
MSVRHVLRALLVLGIAFGSAWGQKVQVQYDHGADFSQYKTYAWKDRDLLTRRGPEGEKRLDELIVSAANAQLKAKGLVESSQSPDLYLSYYAGSVLGSQGPGNAVSVLATDAGGPYTAEITPGGVPNAWFVMNGHITFSFVDPKSDAKVWSSTLQKKFNNQTKLPKDADRQMDEIVRKALQNFPPKTRAKKS